jgi:hypothetical protein
MTLPLLVFRDIAAFRPSVAFKKALFGGLPEEGWIFY